MATVADDFPTFTYTPTDEELEWERQYWELQSQIADYDAYVATQVEAQEPEDGDDDGAYFREEW